jgi:NAD(P)-dependent dehydrogenase (short-subunit alcohol dehydrogenase family)
MIRFDGKVALITGSSGGLGRTYATYLAERGATVVVNGTSETTLRVAEAISSSGGVATPVIADVSRPDDCKRLVEEAVSRWGRLDILINNAGNEPSSFQARIQDLSDDDLRQALAVHVNGAFDLCCAAWPHMVKQRFGRIVNVSSGYIFGSYSDFGIIPHAVAKSAVIGLTRCFALAGRPHRIRVNAVFPAALDTASNRAGWNIPAEDERRLAELVPAGKVAPVVAWLAHEQADCTGELFSVCNENLTRVFIADTHGVKYTDYESMGDCVRAALAQQEFMIPSSIGEFFSTHLGKAASDELFAILQKQRRPPA